MTTKLYETERMYVRPFEESDMTEQYQIKSLLLKRINIYSC